MQAVHRLVLYFDIFRHPLTIAELARLAGGDPRPAVAELAAAGRVEARGGWVYALGRGAHVDARVERTRAAERLWAAARVAGRTLAGFPWVRGVLVTGGLSKQSSPPGGDVDFLLLVEPGRIWTAKSALQLWRRALPGPVRELFCTNYLLATDCLAVPERNMYTAIEIATAVPLHGAEACAAFLDANAWAARYVPGLPWSLARAHAAPTHPASPAARGVEALAALTGAGLESAALRAWDGYWNRKYAWLDVGTRAQRFKRRPEVSTNHLHDFQDYVLRELHRRCTEAGVEAP